MNTIIGSGVLALPSCAAKTGWALYIIVLIASAALTWVGVHFVTACAARLGGDKTSFGAVAARTYPISIILVDLYDVFPSTLPSPLAAVRSSCLFPFPSYCPRWLSPGPSKPSFTTTTKGY